MKPPFIVIIEDDATHIDNIKTAIQGYEFFPTMKDKSFFEHVKNSIDRCIGNEKREKSISHVKDQLLKIQNQIAAYIVDYQLKQDRDNLTGLRFYQEIIKKTTPSKPCIMLTHLKGPKHLNQIIDFVDEINDRNKFTFRLKDLKDIDFRKNLQKFVDDANPISQLCSKALEKVIRNRNKELEPTIQDIKDHWEKYNDETIKILQDFIQYDKEMTDDIQNKFIADLKSKKEN
jgi:trans-2-enoyl-CoA reductase